jgi:Sulfotransferase domain
MALKVIGAGLGRTGTLSLKVALEQLGFSRCYHMAEVLINPSHAPRWVDAANGRADWEGIFDGYAATVDYPGCRYWRELADEYPEAKVVLSVRDPGRWFDSTQATIFAPSNRERLNFPELGEFFEKNVFSHFGEHIHDRDYMVRAFERHNDEVKRSIAPERLLVFEAKDGWEPLCEFLEVPVPTAPFPHANSREEMAAMMAAAQAAGRQTGPPTLEQMGEMVRRRLAGYRQPE